MLYGAAWIDDCSGSCGGTPSLDRLSVTRTDGRPFTLDRIDIGSSYSAFKAWLMFLPEGANMYQSQIISVPHINLALTGTRSDGSTVTAALSSFNELVPVYSEESGNYGPNTLNLTRTGLVDLVSLEIAQTFSFTFDAEVLAGTKRTMRAFDLPPLTDAMPAFLNRCIGTYWCYESLPGVGDVEIDFEYFDGGSNRLSGFSIDALHFDGAPTPPVPLPLPAMALLSGLGALDLLRRFRRG